MARFSAEEINARINDLAIDDDVKIALMEDVSDSINESEELANLRNEVEQVNKNYIDLKEKYKSRFLKSVESDDDKSDDTDEYKESEVIDVKEI